jgi:hypothetical protein
MISFFAIFCVMTLYVELLSDLQLPKDSGN